MGRPFPYRAFFLPPATQGNKKRPPARFLAGAAKFGGRNPTSIYAAMEPEPRFGLDQRWCKESPAKLYVDRC